METQDESLGQIMPASGSKPEQSPLSRQVLSDKDLTTATPSLDEQQRRYEYLRSNCFAAFDDACGELAACLKPLIREAHALNSVSLEQPGSGDPISQVLNGLRLDQEILKLAVLEKEKLPTPDPKRLKDFGNLDAAAGNVLARISPAAIAEANKHLVSQLCVILEAALYYIFVVDEEDRMVLENNLVRAGAELRDMLVRKLFHLAPNSSEGRLMSAASNFASAYERVLLAYDALAKLKKPTATEFSPASWDQMLVLSHAFRVNREMAAPPRLVRGLTTQLADYQRYDRRTFERLADLTENASSFEDLDAVPMWQPLSSWLGQSASSLSVQPFRTHEERNEFNELIRAFEKPITMSIRGADKARSTLATAAFPDENGSDQRLLRWVSTVQVTSLDRVDLDLLERAMLRGASDPGRCGWLAVAALYALRHRQDWEWKQGFSLVGDPLLTRVFAVAHRLYEKLMASAYHPRATNLRMALLWNVVYDPDLGAGDKPHELDTENPTVVALLEDAANNRAALLSERFQFHGSSDLQSLGALYLLDGYRPTLASGLIRWSEKVSSLADTDCRYPHVAALVRDLEGISSSIDWSAAAVRTVPISLWRGYLYGEYTRGQELEERLLQALPPVESFVRSVVRALRSIADMSENQVRAHLRLRRLLPRIQEILDGHFGSGDPADLEAGFDLLDEAIRTDEVGQQSASPLSTLRAELVASLYSENQFIGVKCEGNWLSLDASRRLHWLWRYAGVDTLQFAVREGDQYRLIDLLAFSGRDRNADKQRTEGEERSVCQPSEPFDLAGRLLANQRNPWSGVYCNERPWRIVAEAETTFALLVWCLLNASERLRGGQAEISNWIEGGATEIPCLPGEQDSWREATLPAFLEEFGFQNDNGLPTERLRSFLDWSQEETTCLSRGSFSWQKSELWIGAPPFQLKRFHAGLWPARFSLHRESAINQEQATSNAGRLTVKAIWQLIEEVNNDRSLDTASILEQLEAYRPVVDFREEFAYRRRLDTPVSLIFTPLLAATERPPLLAVLRMSGLFLTAEYRRRAWRGEYGDWYRFGHSVSATYRLSAERLHAVQRVLDVIAPIVLEAHHAANSSK